MTARLSGLPAVRRRRLARRRRGYPPRQPGGAPELRRRRLERRANNGGETRTAAERVAGGWRRRRGRGIRPAGLSAGARTERGTWASRSGMPERERDTGEASRMASGASAAGGFNAGGARSDGGLPAKARRAWGPSFGEGPADRSAEARNARSRGIGSRSFGEGARQSGGEPDARGYLGHLLFCVPIPRVRSFP